LNIEKHTATVKHIALEMGFSFCGISKAGFLEQEAPRLENWLTQNLNGEMGYMANYFDMRVDPRILVPGAKTVVSLLYNYYPKDKNIYNNGDVKIAKYAWGEDYHKVVKSKLKTMLKLLKEQIGDISGRAFVDSAPVLDRAWAAKSGLGWIGKNSMLINKSIGSYFFIAELIIDLELIPDIIPAKDHCGTCTACIDACPTDAILSLQIIDGSKCISYFTIELKGEIPKAYHDKMEGWAFGCDICQDVCPWNKFSQPHHEPKFEPNKNILNMDKKEWLEITEDVFNIITEKSPLQRTKLTGMKRNLGLRT